MEITDCFSDTFSCCSPELKANTQFIHLHLQIEEMKKQLQAIQRTYNNDIPEDVSVILPHALKTSERQPLEQAACTLCEAMDNIMDGDLSGNTFYSFADNPIASQMIEQAASDAQAMQ